MEQSPSWEANQLSASQEIPHTVWNLQVHYCIKCSLPVFILSQLDPIQAPTSHFLKIHLNIILPSMSGSSQWSLSYRFPPKPCIHLSSPPYVPHALPISFFRFYHPKNIWWGLRKQTYVRKFNPAIHSNIWLRDCAERTIVLCHPDQSHNNISPSPTIWESHKPPLVILSPKMKLLVLASQEIISTHTCHFLCTFGFWSIRRIYGLSTE